MELKAASRSKRGIFFSSDALIAVFIILIAILVAFPLREEITKDTKVHYDLLGTLSQISVGESTNPYVLSLSNQGLIKNKNYSLLEQVGEFYVTNITLARNLMQSLLSEVDVDRNVGIWFGNTLISSSNRTPYESAKDVDVARQIISGISEGENVTGFSARAFLSSALQKKYSYFGGYVGDGNISQKVFYDGNISSVEIELAINNDFAFYVNGNFVGNYQKSPSDFVPAAYNVSKAFFSSGENTLEFRGNNLHISGGFIKLIYESGVQYEQPLKKYFPGISGLINIYDGFYIPSKLESLEVMLHVKNISSKTFLAIGNVSFLLNKTEDEAIFYFTDAEFSPVLSYDALSRKTVPIRLGMENVSFVSNKNLDVISVTDLSTSMACSVAGGNCGNGPGQCAVCGGIWLLPLNKSKEAHYVLIDKILGLLTTRLGIRGYHVSVPTSTSQDLTNDSTLLNSIVGSWNAQTLSSENRKLCLAIQSAVEDFQLHSSNDSVRVAIVMSAGAITHGCGITAGDLNLNGIANDPGDQAIQVACDAYQQQKIIFYAIGFGNNTDEATLQAIASCGGGAYYYSNADKIVEVYEQIAESIIAEYRQQTIEASSNLNSILYPDSYIKFVYNSTSLPYGLVLTLEKMFDNSYSGNFSAPENSSFVEARVSSYSGPRWTDKVMVNNNIIYNLTSYGLEYILLGDPYIIHIPNSFLYQGSPNTVTLTTAVSPQNSTAGSSSNKIIYTVVKDFSSFSPIVASAEGCNWHIEFEDGSTLNADLPSNYSGSSVCEYSSGNSGTLANENDAFQIAVRNILREMDFDSNGKVDVLFTSQQLTIRTNEIVGIPFTWATEVQARIWQ